MRRAEPDPQLRRGIALIHRTDPIIRGQNEAEFLDTDALQALTKFWRIDGPETRWRLNMSTIRKIVFGVSLIGSVTAFGLAFALSGDAHDPALPLLNQILDFLIAMGAGVIFVIAAIISRPKFPNSKLECSDGEDVSRAVDDPSARGLTDPNLGYESLTHPVSSHYHRAHGISPDR